jgi:hypothetical protein
MLLLIVLASTTTWAIDPRCWSEPRVFHSRDVALTERVPTLVRLKRVEYTMPKAVGLSPNGYSSLYVFTESDRVLEMRAPDVFHIVDVKWIDEKLVFRSRLAPTCGSKREKHAGRCPGARHVLSHAFSSSRQLGQENTHR